MGMDSSDDSNEDDHIERFLQNTDMDSEAAKRIYAQLLDGFPVTDPWGNQREVLQKLSKAITNDVDIVALNGPVGTGKTYINSTIIRKLKKKYPCVYLVPQLNLIEQVRSDEEIRENFVPIKGRSNYRCEVGTNNDKITLTDGTEVNLTEADESAEYSPSRRYDKFPHTSNSQVEGYGPCCNYMRLIKGKGYSQDACDYAKAMYKANRVLNGETIAGDHKSIITSMKSYFSNKIFWEDPKTGDPRNSGVLILDEADRLEEIAFEEASFTIGNGTLSSLNIEIPKEMNKKGFYEYMNNYLLKAVSDRLDTLREKSGELTIEESQEKRKLNKVKGGVKAMNIITRDGTDLDNMIFENKGYGTYHVEPLQIQRFLRERVFDRFDLIILASATLNEFTLKNYGLEDYNTQLIKARDPREGKNKMMNILPTADMTTSSQAETQSGIERESIKAVCNRTRKIMDKFDDESGIVHCYSNALLDSIYEQLHLSHPQRIIKQTADRFESKEQAIEEFKQRSAEGENVVFLGMRNERGLDLKDDLARFNIITKIPYPKVDKRVKRRDRKWYANRTITKLAQASGRTTRGEDDWSLTFVLDNSVKRLYDNWSEMFHDWLVMKEVDDLDEAMEIVKDFKDVDEGEETEKVEQELELPDESS